MRGARAPGPDVLPQRQGGLTLAAVLVLRLIGCAGYAPRQPPQRTPESIQADIEALIPVRVAQRAAWAVDLQLVFAGLKLDPSTENVCAVLTITEQESTFNPVPTVPNLPKVARDEILRLADGLGVPALAVNLALGRPSPDGRSYDDRLRAVKTDPPQLTGLPRSTALGFSTPAAMPAAMRPSSKHDRWPMGDRWTSMATSMWASRRSRGRPRSPRAAWVRPSAWTTERSDERFRRCRPGAWCSSSATGLRDRVIAPAERGASTARTWHAGKTRRSVWTCWTWAHNDPRTGHAAIYQPRAASQEGVSR